MNNRCKIFIFIAVLFSFFVNTNPLYADWLYSSKTGKWINLSKKPKATPKEQFDYAKSLEDEKKYKAAISEYEIFLYNYASSPLAAEVFFRMGNCFEERQKYYKAYKSYQEIIDGYVSYENIREVIARQYRIGNLFMEGQRRKIMGIPTLASSEKTAEKIFEGIIKNAPYSEYAVKAVYQLGEIKLKNKDYAKATDIYKRVVNDYNNPEFKEAALYKISYCKYMTSKDAGYEQKTTLEAMKSMLEFIKKYPEGKFTDEAVKKANELKTRYAKSLLDKAEFYEKNNRNKSALIYYETIAKEFADTKYNEKALKKIEKLKPKTDEETSNA